ncbi:uncharacterized protein SAMN06265338_105210 [Rhodoblastus acidophilus]|uniref:TPM domain-containing protein n=1 Tax=Rhodoblastus acidophilus TaxID=1074 RepID=A0A212RMH8_RHOAC|nr:TPM domain-containing protein [Rhodoblastus acidophilus]PPQ39178.1 hypothetical protein CKO16_07700 [Rhodoblastus acidophilus]RAI21066.1 hypothetical protein CH337_08575 [Rhodoblastus acidophilus]SNB73754.1 uncharacterized protein SAMN06265338_105210 [Rhodoblastus acidophilus]
MRQAWPSPARQALAWLIMGVLLTFATLAQAQNLKFPELTGRVVDQANVLSPDSRRAVESKLADLENRSSIQFVVATLASLQDQDIETFANLLFRKWGLGEKTKNNGVLLLVAPKERKVRIEVGYGLEGVLTDALSKLIIVNGVAPRFKAGDFAGGIDRGVDDVISILTTDTSEWQKKPDLRQDSPDSLFNAILPFLIVALVILIIWQSRRGGGGGGPFIVMGGPGGSSGGGGWGGSSGGGDSGFSGGGGSSGGGGASGDW